MSSDSGSTIAQDAEQFAGLDTERVFADIAAGRFISGYDALAAVSQVKASHPELTDALEAFANRVRGSHGFWD